MLCIWQSGKNVNLQAEQTDSESLKTIGELGEDVQYLKLFINIYRAEALPHIDIGILSQLRKTFSVDVKDLLTLFAQVNLGDLMGKTKKEKSWGTYCWNQQIIFVTKFPLQPLSVTVQIRDDNLMVNNVVGMIVLDLDKISDSDSKGFLPTFGPCYVHLYDKDTRKKKDNVSYRGKLLMSVFSEIISSSNIEKPYVAVEPVIPLPEGSLGKEEDFLLFACIREGMMIESRLAEKKNIRFTLHLGNQPEDLSRNNAIGCPFKNSLSNFGRIEKENSTDEVEDVTEDENCTRIITPVKTNKRYYHLPLEENKPCLASIFSCLDNRRRMYIANILERMRFKIKDVLEKLHECSDFETFERNSFDSVLSDLKVNIDHFSKTLNRNWDMFSSKTALDVERKKIYESIAERLESLVEEKTLEPDRTALKTTLDKLECVFQDLVSFEEDPQPALPDVLVWMESNYKRVAYSKILSREILYSASETERGRLCGKMVSMPFRPFFKRSNESVCAKVDLYLWLGLLKHTEYCLKSLPQGYRVAPANVEGSSFVPRTLEYHEKQPYQLRAHIYQARSLPYSDVLKYPGFFIQVLVGNRYKNTQIKDNTLNPIWDETVVFKNLLFYGHGSEMDRHPPEIVIEIHSLTKSGQSVCVCRDIVPVLKSQGLPFLKWFPVASTEAGEPAQVLAAFEILPIDNERRDRAEALEDALDDVGPVLQIPASVRPRFAPHRVEILFWGLRELTRVNLMTLEAPRLELECGGKTIQSSLILNYKKHSNFVKMVETIDMDLPEREGYLPSITIRLQDCKSFGRRNVLASHVIHSLRKYLVKANGEVLEPKFSKQADPRRHQYGDVAIDVEEPGETFPEDAFAIQSVEIPWTSSEKSPEKTSELEDEEEDWWTRYYISNGGREKAKPNVLPNRFAKSERRKTLAELVIGDKKKMPDNLDPKAFVVYLCELENVPEFGGFEEWLHSFKLNSGKRFSRFIKPDREKTVAIFKGCFRIYKLPLPPHVVDPFLPCGNVQEGLFNALPENKPTKVLVRVYVVKAIDLTPSDITNTTDPYLVMQVGSQRFSDKANYISKQLNPVFGKCFEFVSCLPRDAVLHIQVMDWDLMGSDDLIGGTKIDLENRFYSRCRPTCGLPRTYDTSGPNAWRDFQTPLEILTTMCLRSGLGSVRVSKRAIRISDVIYKFENSDSPEGNEQDMALYLLHRWQDIAPGKHQLVPEHLETRTLYHPSKPGEPQGKLVMWVDMFPENTVPPGPPRDISPRSPVPYELRVIIWNTDEVVLADDAFMTGEKMSDIYVKGHLIGKEDVQSTDVHYRSLTGEGNFNWRFAFPFDYLSTERKVVVTKKASVFSWDESEFKMPLRLTLQVWDADFFKRDDYLGEVVLHLHNLPRWAKTPDKCWLGQLGSETPTVSLFKQRRVRGWWPVSAAGQNGRAELTGKIEAELHLLTREEADKFPAGLGRKEPDALNEPKRPSTSFANYLHPLKTFRYAFWKRYRRKFVTVLAIAALACLLLLFVYSVPGYAVKKLMRA